MSNFTTPTHYLEYPISLAAGSSVTLFQKANCMAPLAVSGTVIFSVDDSEASPLRQGVAIKLDPGESFQKVLFTNNGGSTATFTVAFSDGEIKDQRLTTTTAVKSYAGDNLITPALVAVNNTAGGTVVSASNPTKTRAIVQNTSKTDSIWVGDNTIDGSLPQGLEIKPGGDITLETSAEIRARTLAGITANVVVLEIRQ